MLQSFSGPSHYKYVLLLLLLLLLKYVSHYDKRNMKRLFISAKRDLYFDLVESVKLSDWLIFIF